jgi:hypothetical protein
VRSGVVVHVRHSAGTDESSIREYQYESANIGQPTCVRAGML